MCGRATLSCTTLLHIKGLIACVEADASMACRSRRPSTVIKFATGADMFFLRWRVWVPRVQQSTQGVCRAAGLPGLPGFGRTNESSVEFSPGARGAPCYS